MESATKYHEFCGQAHASEFEPYFTQRPLTHTEYALPVHLPFLAVCNVAAQRELRSISSSSNSSSSNGGSTSNISLVYLDVATRCPHTGVCSKSKKCALCVLVRTGILPKRTTHSYPEKCHAIDYGGGAALVVCEMVRQVSQ